jgi:stage V sporulation protein SpoVS
MVTEGDDEHDHPKSLGEIQVYGSCRGNCRGSQGERTCRSSGLGAGAVNQAVKAVAIARGYLAEDGIEIVCIPSFTEVMIGDQERTAIKLIVDKK